MECRLTETALTVGASQRRSAKEGAVRQFIADNGPARLWMGVVPLAVPALVCWLVAPLPWLIDHWLNPVLFAGLLLVAWAVGWFAAIIPGWLVLGPLYHDQGLRNGAPYRVGEYARVLTRRRCCGQVARVYEVWAERCQVRLDLGEAARERVEDVFSYFEVCRAWPVEPVALADPPCDSTTMP